MFAKPASLVLLLAVFLQEATGSFALSIQSPKTGLGRRQSSSVTTTTVTAETFTAQWSSVSTAFTGCKQTFQSGATVEAAYTSVTTVSQTCNKVATQYPSCSSCTSAGQSYASTFQKNIQVSFQTWQEIILIGQQRYASVWQSRFVTLFASFDVWVKAAGTACSSFSLDLGVIIRGLRLDLNLFAGIHLNLSVILGINLSGAIGGVIGGILKRETLLLE